MNPAAPGLKKKKAAIPDTESQERYRQLFEQNPMIMYVIDLDTLSLLEANQKAVRQYGYSKTELLKMSVLQIRETGEQEKLVKYLAEVKAGKNPSAGIWHHKSKTGKKFLLEISYLRLDYDGHDAIIAMAQDVTERVRVEEQQKTENRLKQNQVTEAVIAAQEKERALIGRELHDNINQVLGATRLYIDVAMRDEEKRDELLKKSSANLLTAMEEIRKLSRTLVGPPITHIGLHDSIEGLIDDINQASRLNIRLTMHDFPENDFDEKFNVNLFRIIQEQLINIVKHADARNVQIFLSRNNSEIKLMVIDDGRGFDHKKPRKGIGIINMSSRVDLYNGRMNIISSPDEGCQLMINIPFPLGHSR
ncbi:MAG: PAS domain-containing sensor histidine kinase [Gemmatimonadaceae bacterium]|nr:PAS domain-containing sensor histidine kinase [Chitinophagaceae bacterium]